MKIFTVGHSTRTFDEFVAMLHGHGVRRVVDVRRYPGSRRHPHFSRDSLATSLPAAGIAYIHAPELGGRRVPAPDSPNDAWRSASFRAYADHMASDGFRAWLERLLAWAMDDDTAIMCAEAVPWRCHRQLIADALVAHGVDVAHILNDERADPHTLNPHAVVDDAGNLTYPAKPPDPQGSLFP